MGKTPTMKLPQIFGSFYLDLQIPATNQIWWILIAVLKQTCNDNFSAERKIFDDDENRTLGGWVRSANATSVLCRPSVFKFDKSGFHDASGSRKFEFNILFREMIFFSNRFGALKIDFLFPEIDEKLKEKNCCQQKKGKKDKGEIKSKLESH